MERVQAEYDELRLCSPPHQSVGALTECTDDATALATFHVLSRVPCDEPSGGPWSRTFLEEFRELSQRWGAETLVELSVTCPRDFPVSPPSFRLIRPTLVSGTSCVVNGAFVVPSLMPEGWNPSFTLAMALSFVMDALANSAPRLDPLSPPCFYPVQAYRASLNRLATARPVAAAYVHPQSFNRTKVVYSGEYAARVMGLPLPPGFEAGNKVLAPLAMLEQLARGETEAAVRQGGGSSVLPVSLQRVDSSTSFSESAAMVFELTGPVGITAFAGIADFIVPHPDVLVLPSCVMASLAAAEGVEVSLRRVRLPAVTSITLQPHAGAFTQATAHHSSSSGSGPLGPREFLEASLLRHVSLQAGDVIVCHPGARGGGEGLGQGGDAEQQMLEAAQAASLLTAAADGEVVPVSPSCAGQGSASAAAAGGVSASNESLSRVDDDVLSALLAAGVSVDELSQSARLASELDAKIRGEAAPGSSLSSAAAGVSPPHSEDGGAPFRFTVVAVQPADAPAVALWGAFSAQVEIDLLPAADEFLLPMASGSTSGGPWAPAQQPSPAVGDAGGLSSSARASFEPLPVPHVLPGESWASSAPLPASVADSVLPAAPAGHRLGGALPAAGILPASGEPESATREERRRRAAEAAARRFGP